MDATFDPNSLQGLLSQFQPTEADRQAARHQAQLQFFLGLLGAPKGAEWQRIGQSGAGALGTYQSMLMNAPKLRMENAKAAADITKTLKDMQFTDMGLRLIGGGQPSQLPQQSASGGADVVTSPLPQQQAPSPTNLPSWANPRAELGFALAGKKDVADVIHRQYQVTQGPSGTLMRNGQIVGQVIPNAGMVIDGQFQPLPKEVTDALINFNTAQKKGEAQAQASQDVVMVPSTVNGLPGPSKAMTRADYAASVSGQQPQAGLPPSPQQPPQQQPTPYSLQGNFSPQDLARIQQDAQVNGARPFNGRLGVPVPQQGQPQFGMTASPFTTDIAKKRAETDIQTGGALNQELGAGVIKQIDKSYEAASDAATKAIPSIHEARAILDSHKVITGVGSSWALQFGRVLSQLGMGGDDAVANTQTFIANQAKSVMGVVKQLGSGSGISNSDREYAAKAQGGQIDMNEQSLRRILDIGERASRLLIEKHNGRVDKAANSFDRKDLTDWYTVPMPDLYVSPTQSARAPMIGPNGQSQPMTDYTAPSGKGWSIKRIQ